MSAAEEVTELTGNVEEFVPTQPAKVRQAVALPAQRSGTAVPRVSRPSAKESTEVQKFDNQFSGVLGGLGWGLSFAEPRTAAPGLQGTKPNRNVIGLKLWLEPRAVATTRTVPRMGSLTRLLKAPPFMAPISSARFEIA